MGIRKVFESLLNTNQQHWGTHCDNISAQLKLCQNLSKSLKYCINLSNI